MKFDRLRLIGFKSFVDPVDLDILPGMTGVVGPNGCGKSNLLEALRWVMGETSYKSMRGSGMEDVIFAGTNARPARNHAEVVLMLDNAARKATAEFNDSDNIEVVRRIERDAGSVYRINGRDVRARDVQLMFADASTGSRSNSLVKQGQIGEIINVKPEARRRILEEAAGISGLHSRRHEAELRLSSADRNLEKLGETITNLETELRQLRRQARQASRYKNISGQIREVEALSLHLRWQQAADAVAVCESELVEARKAVSKASLASAQASTEQSGAQASLAELRDSEAAAAAALRRLTLEQESLDGEAQRAEEMIARLKSQIETVLQDVRRETQTLADAKAQLKRLAGEEAEIRASISDDEQAAEAEAAAQLEAAMAALSASEAAYDAANRAAAEYQARKQALDNTLAQNAQRREKLLAEQKQAENSRSDVERAILADFDVAARRSDLQELESQNNAAVQALNASEKAYREAREAQSTAGEPAREARAALERLVGEREALASLFAKHDETDYAALVDDVTVTHGYETALGAALGDDLEASSDMDAPTAWAKLGAEALAQDLPYGVEGLAVYVAGSPLLTRALSQVGLVARHEGAKLQSALLPGQKLVSPEGDLWRWDGYSHKAEAPIGAAKRLAQRARLQDLQDEISAAETALSAALQAQEDARGLVETASAAQDNAREEARHAQNAVAEAQKSMAEVNSAMAAKNEKLKALDGSLKRIAADLDELSDGDEMANGDLQHLGGQEELVQAVETARGTMESARLTHDKKRSALDGLKSRREARDARMQRLVDDGQQWSERKQAAGNHIEALAERQAASEEELSGYQHVPHNLAERRAKLADLLVEAEATRQKAADELAQAETKLGDADSRVRETQAATAEVRETQVRLEATLEANQQRLQENAQRVREALQIEPEQALAVSGHDPEKPFPEAEAMESKLEKLRRERESLGGVNLRAGDEADEVQEQIDAMTAEHDELTAAINKLRHGIGQLNREGRQRLLAAFEAVNGHFKRLFTQLFGGGSAELTLTESEDPLQAGLEILAHPPGKKPQVMSLLSGGEQALTATALIFAVFLTNPSPICVLDEVDAPLDDTNVERFCNLVKEIADETGTRFLVITHHALTMARMDRLFGVTMQERGVSQLLSVDLTTAEQFAESDRDKNADKDILETKSIG